MTNFVKKVEKTCKFKKSELRSNKSLKAQGKCQIKIFDKKNSRLLHFNLKLCER